ncbi:polyribonucleotide nucleotidyltransferase [Chrysiogenes arsenatis]|uniref:polyribonucleotide nucleotidyltransferase n=1 Tax=Chrysiogenes arsenatis TaxID=309797 RepID=UPI00040B7521|nr:polyribonucleotide nucleotidyltransferase [Chrysiogenes arsenatis]
MHSVSVEFGGKIIEIETGKVARQADGAVLVKQGDNVVLVTAVSSKSARDGIDFFPLTVNYQEKRYSTGKVPGGYKKREGMPSDGETLISRLIDRPLRPLFPEGYVNETQVIATVLASDGETPADALAMYGAACALHISDIPFGGPLGACRIGRINGEFVLNPTFAQMRESDIDIFLASTRGAILMVEAGANEVPNDDIVAAIAYGHDAIGKLLDAQEELRRIAGNPKREYSLLTIPTEIMDQVDVAFRQKINDALSIGNKLETYEALSRLKSEVSEYFTAQIGAEAFEPLKKHYKAAFSELERRVLRWNVLDHSRRVDGRALDEIRQITIEPSFLPRVHGSVLFTRGETQAIVVTTLGTSSDEQFVENLEGESKSNYLFHYNFPPYSVGECGILRSPGRREIGHGALARRAIEPILPKDGSFPYTLRIVSEITESNGSSSMASACGASLSLMDAGVPVTGAVSGIAMGLILEGDRYSILSDILGLEDHLGDMDFKVAGTARGVTALQMDIKVEGITIDIMKAAIAKAHEGRMFILGKMNDVLAMPRAEMSEHAPRIVTIQVKPDRIRDIIGTGGKIIRGIVEETGAKIDIEDSGLCRVASSNAESLRRAVAIIEGILTEPEIGKVYRGTVKKIAEFGAFVEFLPNTDGLLHISQIDHRRIAQVTDVLNEGDVIDVKLIEIDSRTGKFKLSRKELLERPEGMAEEESHGGGERPPRRPHSDRDHRGGDRDRGDRGGYNRNR